MQINFKHPLATHAALDVLGYRRNGAPIYAIAGGNGEGETGATDANDGGQDAGTGDGTTGQQGTQGGASTGGDTTDWKAKARQWESRAKENKTAAEELAALRAAQMSDQEKAVQSATEQGRTAALAEAAPEIAQARLEAAAARKGVDLAPFADLLDISKFIADGKVDGDAITAAVDRLAKLAPPNAGRSGGDFSGSSGNAPLDIDQQIEAAQKAKNFGLVFALKRQKAAQT
jgi:hypothetical protein